jgi:hypothetical protein
MPPASPRSSAACRRPARRPSSRVTPSYQRDGHVDRDQGAEPETAAGLSAVLNLTGAFLSLSVAATIASGLVDTGLVTLAHGTIRVTYARPASAT